MKKPKDISDVFRENAHKLDERPPERIWRQLDKRLDESGFRQTKKRKLLPAIYRISAVAATVIILISLVSRFLSPADHGQGAMALMEDHTASPMYEELVSDATESAAVIREIRLLYASYTPRYHAKAARKSVAVNKLPTAGSNRAKGEQSVQKSLQLVLQEEGRQLYILLPDPSQPLVLKPEGREPLNFYPTEKSQGSYFFEDENGQIKVRWLPAQNRMEIQSASTAVFESLKQQLQPFFVLQEDEHLLVRQPLHQNHD